MPTGSGYLVITPVDGYEFVSDTATKNGAPLTGYYGFPGEGQEYSLAYYLAAEGDVYYFETRVLTPKQATLKVDDYTHISVSNQGEAVALTANETTLTKPKGTCPT